MDAAMVNCGLTVAGTLSHCTETGIGHSRDDVASACTEPATAAVSTRTATTACIRGESQGPVGKGSTIHTDANNMESAVVLCWEPGGLHMQLRLFLLVGRSLCK